MNSNMPMVGDTYVSHGGKGPDRMRVVQVTPSGVACEYTGRRRMVGFVLPERYFSAANCGWKKLGVSRRVTPIPRAGR